MQIGFFEKKKKRENNDTDQKICDNSISGITRAVTKKNL